MCWIGEQISYCVVFHLFFFPFYPPPAPYITIRLTSNKSNRKDWTSILIFSSWLTKVEIELKFGLKLLENHIFKYNTNLRNTMSNELIKSYGLVKLYIFLKVCYLLHAFLDQILLYFVIRSSDLNNFLVEPFEVLSKRFVFPLQDGFEGGDRLRLGPWSCEVSCELVAQVIQWVN